MAETTRTFSKGELLGAVVAALAVGFFLGSMFMELRQAAPTGSQALQQAGESAAAPGQPVVSPDLLAQIRDMEIAMAQKPGDQSGWVELANAYFDTHQAQKAITAYEKAVAIGPVSPDVWTDFGIMRRQAGQPQKALECFDTALKLDPRHQNALFNKGVVQLHDLQDRAGALGTWERLLKLNPAAKDPGGRLVQSLVDELKKG
jgi:cytochrome c-type biogenesis protein CcmH/NrfG